MIIIATKRKITNCNNSVPPSCTVDQTVDNLCVIHEKLTNISYANDVIAKLINKGYPWSIMSSIMLIDI